MSTNEFLKLIHNTKVLDLEKNEYELKFQALNALNAVSKIQPLNKEAKKIQLELSEYFKKQFKKLKP